ncbi:MAG: terpene cyclase/mutase family protein [Planctomycetes bacterium]|nr:terpene cyclase/mutase family protein [Planctomycetota bacterium]
MWPILLALTMNAGAQDQDTAVPSVEATPQQGEAVARGLAFLASQQNRDGSWSSGSYQRHVGVTGLCLIAFLSGGHLPEEGTYASRVSEGITFLLQSTQRDGYITSEDSNMYGHGFATLCFAEVYGMSPQHPEVAQKLRDAVSLIVRTQKADGGWRYTPDRSGFSDLSVSVCQVQALRAARNAGMKVPKETIDQAVEFVRKCANPDGSFRYMTQAPNSSLALTAAAVTALYGAGEYESKVLVNGVDYLRNYARFDFRRLSHYYYYAHYYAAQAMFQAGGKDWELWFPKIREDLLNKQRPEDGSWKGDEVGPVYGTAMAVIILQIPCQYLPIFQR